MVGNQEKYLFGWYRVTLENTGNGRPAEIIIIQAHAQNMHIAPSGAFVRKNTKKCGSNMFTKEKRNYLPCNWAHDPMPFVSIAEYYEPGPKSARSAGGGVHL